MQRIERFCKTTRWFHWTFALSFCSLAASGTLLLCRAELSIEPADVAVLIEFHKITAIVFLTAPWLIGLSGDRRAWLRDLSETARFTRDDLVWLVRQPLAMLGKAELPAQDKLNAGQKLNALAVAAEEHATAFLVETRCAAAIARERLTARQREGRDPSDAGPDFHAISAQRFETPREWPRGARAVVRTDAPWRGRVRDLARRLAPRSGGR